MKDATWKWLYTLVLLGATIGWAAFCVLIVKSAIAQPTAVNIIEAAGATTLLGALIAWNGNVNQYWFRKKGPPQTGENP